MELLKNIVTTLFNSHVETETKDNTGFCEYKAKDCHQLKEGIKDALPALLGAATKDDVLITVVIDGINISYNSASANNAAFFEAWEKAKAKEKGEDIISLTIHISKSIHDNSWLQVYSSDKFFSYLQSLSILEFIKIISELLKLANGKILFFAPDLAIPFSSENLFFTNKDPEETVRTKSLTDRKTFWERYRSASYFAGNGLDDIVVLPEDLVLFQPSDNEGINELFNQAALILLLGIIYDYSELKGETLSLKLNGYKTFRKELELKSIVPGCLDSYYEIYKWIGNGGSLTDKIGLARNLISLHLDADGYTIPESVFSSIKSGFKFYEKQNVKQYIELRNKMSDQLLGFNEKASKIVEGFAGSLHKSILGVVSLYASLIIAKVFTSQNLISAFTLDVTIISVIFLCISYAVFRVSRKETKEQKERFVNSYKNMKRRYEDLLEPEDIKKILNEDEEYNKDIAYIENKTKTYSRLWIIVIALLAVATIILHGYYRINS